ncbi:MAG: toll/interleukin-1 receptor domain-containing protein, partial [Pyrinomonadaceae bacterium]|nr:toll/interleukin-1 receptor domain-containing protein [Pyrinomonadaceae bacterium]
MSNASPQETEMPPQDNYKYWAFISYSHADEEWAEWLHKSLETYRIPKKLVGREIPVGTVPRRLFPVFRDRDELPGASDLGGNIKQALSQSRY